MTYIAYCGDDTGDITLNPTTPTNEVFVALSGV